jgi:TolB-like protein/DNA-binding winged helix-turn-helix (wHTH) protein/Tfp pilus assembly protein PilF
LTKNQELGSFMPDSDNHGAVRIGDLVVDANARSVTRDGREIDLPRLSFDLLLALIEAAPGPVSGDELMARVWNGVVVSPATISKRVELLRQALDDDAANPRYVELVRGYGYRLATPVEPSVYRGRGRTRHPVAFGVAAGAVILLLFMAWHMVTDRAAKSSPSERTIAVLPFESLGGEAEERWFADGLTEEIAHEIARNGSLLVTGRTSAFAMRDAEEDARALGQALGVAFLLEGSIRQDNATLRVIVRLTETAEGFQVWSETFDAPVEDALRVQRAIASTVAERLVPGNSRPERRDPAAESQSPEAYALYLQAVSLSPYPDGIDLPHAQSLIEQVVRLDPEFAPGWNRLAAIHGRRLFFDPAYHLPVPESLLIVRDAVERALAIDPTIGEAYANLAGIAWAFDHDLDKTADLLEQATRLDPWNLEILGFARDFARAIGDLQTSVKLGQLILRRDPLCTGCRAQLAGTLECLGKREAAERELRVLDRGDSTARFALNLAKLRLQAGDMTAARAYLERVESHAQQLAGEAMLEQYQGNSEAAAALMDELAELDPARHWMLQASTAAMLGDNDLAMERLELGAAAQFVFAQGLICEAGPWNALRQRQDWQALMTALGRNPDGSQAVSFSLPPFPGGLQPTDF